MYIYHRLISGHSYLFDTESEYYDNFMIIQEKCNMPVATNTTLTGNIKHLHENALIQ